MRIAPVPKAPPPKFCKNVLSPGVLMCGCIRFCLDTNSSIQEFHLIFVVSRKLWANRWYGIAGSMEFSMLDAKLQLVVLYYPTPTVLAAKDVGCQQARCARPEPSFTLSLRMTYEMHNQSCALLCTSSPWHTFLNYHVGGLLIFLM